MSPITGGRDRLMEKASGWPAEDGMWSCGPRGPRGQDGQPFGEGGILSETQEWILRWCGGHLAPHPLLGSDPSERSGE